MKRQVYQIKITLKGIRPPVWRRVEVVSDTTLKELHEIIQIVMGWSNYHLHQFIIGRRYYGQPDPDYDDDMEDEKDVKLFQMVRKEKSKFTYEYDFGDCWEHEILIEKILSVKEGKQYPICIKGKRACPPEDIGGVWGYAEFLEAIKDPRHSEHEDLLEWIGGEFNPEEFDLEDINNAIESLM